MICPRSLWSGLWSLLTEDEAEKDVSASVQRL